jgi:hypothetical protein
MSQKIAIQELSIVLAAPGQSPAIVNLENLIFNGTIPKEWELSREPMYSAQSAQIAFTNSVVVTAQGNRVVFSESLMGKGYGELHISSLALRYVRSFSQLSYEAVGINPMGHADMGGSEESVRQYFNENLLSEGSWHQIEDATAQVQLNFRYNLPERTLNLAVSEVGLRNEDESMSKVVLFSGNFQYLIDETQSAERLEAVNKSLVSCESDLAQFMTIVDSKFLGNASEFTVPTLLPAFA